MVTEMGQSQGVDGIAQHLQEYLARRFPGAITSGFRFLTSGFESEVFTFDLCFYGEAPKALVLRLYPGVEAGGKMTREAQGLIQLRKDGYPVPAMLLYETQASILGEPFCIMQKLEGRSLWRVLAEADPKRRDLLLDRFGRLIARLHQLNWRPYTGQAQWYEQRPQAVLEELCATMQQQVLQYEVKGFLPILDWLEDRLPRILVQLAVVHLDLHANNVLLLKDEPGEPSDRLAVIDWTQAAVCDCRIDLCWTLMIMGDYGSPEWAERILGAYQQRVGRAVEDLDYFNVFSYTKLLASRVIVLQTNPQALGMRPETAQSIQEQTPTLLRLSRRIRKITGLSVPEVETILEQAGQKNDGDELT